LIRELVEWRLAEYLGRKDEDNEPEPPEAAASKSKGGLELWQPYQRKEIPPLFGLKFSTGNWNAGFVSAEKHMFLLVTLAKETKTADFQYEDRFITPNTFQWQSQNQTTQESGTGRRMHDHKSMGITVHLFVRRDSKTPNGTGAPFYYCGDVEFVDWDGEKPITVQWRLMNALPKRLQDSFQTSKVIGA
jgi:hypothetical protein